MDNSWIGNYSHSRARLNADGVAVVDLDTNKKYSYGDLDRRANCSQTYEFRKPVYLGENIRTEVEVLEKLPHHRLRMRTQVMDSKGDIVLDGIAVIKTYR